MCSHASTSRWHFSKKSLFLLVEQLLKFIRHFNITDRNVFWFRTTWGVDTSEVFFWFLWFIENKRTPSFLAAPRKGESFQKNNDFVDEKFLLCLFPEINFQIIWLEFIDFAKIAKNVKTVFKKKGTFFCARNSFISLSFAACFKTVNYILRSKTYHFAKNVKNGRLADDLPKKESERQVFSLKFIGGSPVVVF